MKELLAEYLEMQGEETHDITRILPEVKDDEQTYIVEYGENYSYYTTVSLSDLLVFLHTGERGGVMTSNLNDWIYIYYIRDGLLRYDRSVSRHGLGLSRAKQVVCEWEKRGCESFYTIGTLTKTEALS